MDLFVLDSHHTQLTSAEKWQAALLKSNDQLEHYLQLEICSGNNYLITKKSYFAAELIMARFSVTGKKIVCFAFIIMRSIDLDLHHSDRQVRNLELSLGS